MSMEDAVCDTSTLIRLRKGSVLDCLGKLFNKIYIPEAVLLECQDPLTQEAIRQTLIEVRNVSCILPITSIGLGELEAISLAVELCIDTFITDDDRAFRKAHQHNLFPIRSYQILFLAKHAHYIESLKTVLDSYQYMPKE
jgi:predicted nucleic acid-binding protein